MNKILFFLVVITLLSCSNNQPATKSNSSDKVDYPVKPLVIANAAEDGWGADIKLSITAITNSDSFNTYKAISTYEGKEIGLLVEVPKAKEGGAKFGKGIAFKSLGAESDNLLAVLEKLYKQKPGLSFQFTPSISVDFVDLQEYAKSLSGEKGGDYKTSNEYKLFFQGKNEDEYAELYLNINAEERWLQLNEKDEEYRPALIKFLKK